MTSPPTSIVDPQQPHSPLLAHSGAGRYSVFGGCLLSELPLSGLRGCGVSHADWTLTRALQPPLSGAIETLGEDQVDAGVRVHAFRLPGGFRLEYDDTGTFDVLNDGEQIVWCAGSDARPEAVQLDLLGRVLPLALHASGTLCLHGSAVATAGAGLAFLAPKFHGKSTVAQALVAAGARLASDDVVPVRPGSMPMMWPGVHSVRLWSDSLEHLLPHLPGGLPLPVEKRVLDLLPDDRLMLEPHPLAAIYLLKPTPLVDAPREPRRTEFSPLLGAIALLRETKLGPLLGETEAALLLKRVVAIAEAAPIYTLEFARDWERLPRVAEQLLEWHHAAQPALPAAQPAAQ